MFFKKQNAALRDKNGLETGIIVGKTQRGLTFRRVKALQASKMWKKHFFGKIFSC